MDYIIVRLNSLLSLPSYFSSATLLLTDVDLPAILAVVRASSTATLCYDDWTYLSLITGIP